MYRAEKKIKPLDGHKQRSSLVLKEPIQTLETHKNHLVIVNTPS